MSTWPWLHLTLQSIRARRTSSIMIFVMIALSISLLLMIDRIRQDTRSSFGNTLSGTDLIVGARTGPVNLLLFSAFNIGYPSNNLTWDSYQRLKHHPNVAWTIPLVLGDSHSGYRVVATNENYLKHFRYGRNRSLSLQSGGWFTDHDQVVLGHEVARQLEYQVNTQLTLAHGTGSTSFHHHDEQPFQISGILSATGTPVDRMLFISIESAEALHSDQADIDQHDDHPEHEHENQLAIEISALLIGMNNRTQAFTLQRQINDYSAEPLTAIIPGLTLFELWRLVSLVEKALFAVSGLAIIIGLTGMLGIILTGLNERRKELAVLRALGAHPSQLLLLLILESGLYGVIGTLLGIILHWLLILGLSPWTQAQFGVELNLTLVNSDMSLLLLGFILTALVLGMIPGINVYRQSLSHGLNR